MADSGGLVLRVYPGPDEDAGELAELAGRLSGELLDLDVAATTGCQMRPCLRARRAWPPSLGGWRCSWARRHCGRCWRRWPTG